MPAPPTDNTEDGGEGSGFRVRLSNFEGPFDLLLQLITRKKLDVTEVALSEVTDEFIAYTRTLDHGRDLDEVTGVMRTPMLVGTSNAYLQFCFNLSDMFD